MDQIGQRFRRYGELGTTAVIRLDASIVTAHSDKTGAKGTFKGVDRL
jgi:glycyl-tRNA synthetase (class II)